MKRLLFIVLLLSMVVFAAYADDPATDAPEPEAEAVVTAETEVAETAEADTAETPEAETTEPVDTVGPTDQDNITTDGDLLPEDSPIDAAAEKEILERPRVAVVLAGGGAKGIAHIPILEALESYGIPIDKVFGTSMGALIGGLYCAGLSPKEMTEIVLDNDLMSLFSTLDTSGYKEIRGAFDYNTNNIVSISLGQGIGGVSGIIDDYQVLNFFQKCIGNVPADIDFDTDLPTPFECNATNMLNGNEIIFRGGSLTTAMRSSMSLPLVFEPVILDDGMVLMDGGMVSNYIVHRAVEEGYDIIICVTLNGYGKKPIKAESYNSLSGVASGALSIVLNNASKGEAEMASYMFSPDLTDYGTLSFSDAEGILGQGYKEVEEQRAKLEEIASYFTEEQKVYKDPNRVGDYYTWFEEVPKQQFLASADARHEDFLGRTRLSFGLYGHGGYAFYFNEEDEDNRLRRYALPTISARGFISDINGTPFSLDIRLKTTFGTTTDLSVAAMYRLTEDYGMRVYGVGRLKSSIGSLSSWTDTHQDIRFKMTEGSITADAGVMLTNEKDQLFEAYLTAQNIWSYGDTNYDDPYRFMPGVALEYVYFPNYKAGFFGDMGGRFDVLTYLGYNTKSSNLEYKIAIAGENNFHFNDRFSMWLEGTAFSSRGPIYDRSTFEFYGGWDGMPGYVDVYFADFINAGIGFQLKLSSGIASSFITFVVRGGVRSEVLYGGLFQLEHKDFETMVPFKEAFGGIWDLGASLGYGISTPVGDVIIGLGFNKDMQMAIYFELQ